MNKKEKIYKATLELLANNKHIGSIKVADVAELAGMGKSTVYEYFPDKKTMFSESVLYYIREQIEDINNITVNNDFKTAFYKVFDYAASTLQYKKVLINYMFQIYEGDIPDDIGDNEVNTEIDISIKLVVEKFWRKGLEEKIISAEATLRDVIYSVLGAFIYLNYSDVYKLHTDYDELKDFCYNKFMKGLNA
ncbi:MAG: TetR/AcrR family transcriptional regulator [Ruminococcus sp.]|nr:TetR/AcrR family transcriptional regulator [Ruminococcus sp.]